MHTGEDPEIYQIQTQNQAKQDDWPKETWKKCPIKVIQTTTRARLSLSPPVCLSTHTVLFFLLINTLLASLLYISMWKFISTKLTGQGLVTGRWSLVVWWSGGFSLWLGTEILLQAEATQDHFCSLTPITQEKLRPTCL